MASLLKNKQTRLRGKREGEKKENRYCAYEYFLVGELIALINCVVLRFRRVGISISLIISVGRSRPSTILYRIK
jgi:hypothetical protein